MARPMIGPATANIPPFGFSRTSAMQQAIAASRLSKPSLLQDTTCSGRVLEASKAKRLCVPPISASRTGDALTTEIHVLSGRPGARNCSARDEALSRSDIKEHGLVV